MSKYELRKLKRTNESDYKKWKNGLKDFIGSTIFHDPDFLSYHGAKFEEYHLGIFKGEELFGMLPLAIVENENEKVLKSPYGASYGGFVFKAILNYSDSKEIVEKFIELTKDLNINSIVITPSLAIYHESYSDTFIFALLELGFKCINSDITSIVTLREDNKLSFNTRAKRVLKKVDKKFISINYDAPIDDFYILIDKTFHKHGVNPTHSKENVEYLKNLFPDKINFPIAYYENKPVAAIGEFEINNKVLMSFYICQDDEYKSHNLQTYLIQNLLDNAFLKKYSFYDFGTSSVNMIARENIFSFKEGLGATGHFRNTYRLDF